MWCKNCVEIIKVRLMFIKHGFTKSCIAQIYAAYNFHPGASQLTCTSFTKSSRFFRTFVTNGLCSLATMRRIQGDKMIQNESKTRNQTKIKLVIDVIIFVAFLIAMDPRSTGIAVHEWLAISLIAALVVHLLLSWNWITQITRRFAGKMSGQLRINYILNWLLFIDGSVIMLSGFMISESVLPALGISLPRNFVWRSLHEFSTNLFLLLLGLHTALHWSWVVDAFKRYVFQPIGRIFPANSRKDMTA
jgi:hypothetical membrane protein